MNQRSKRSGNTLACEVGVVQSMSHNQLRWGILGTANIARKNWQAIRDSGNGIVTSVASRELKKAQEFITSNQSTVPMPGSAEIKAFASYEELLMNSEIDAVYIPLPTGCRMEWVEKAAKAGKHIVCEKPCGASLAQVEQMIKCCKESKVQFSDGVMFVHSRRLDAIRQVLACPGEVGEIRRVASGFSFNGGPDFLRSNIRMDSRLEPHGCLGDLGWYNIRFALWLMEGRLPERVSGRIISSDCRPGSPASVPTEFEATLDYPKGVSMGFYNSFVTHDQQWVHISGGEGSIVIEDFVLPFFAHDLHFETRHARYLVEGCSFNMERHFKCHSVKEYSNNHPTSQESNLYRTFAAQVLSGNLNSEWPDMALKNQAVMEACLKSARSGGSWVTL